MKSLLTFLDVLSIHFSPLLALLKFLLPSTLLFVPIFASLALWVHGIQIRKWYSSKHWLHFRAVHLHFNTWLRECKNDRKNYPAATWSIHLTSCSKRLFNNTYQSEFTNLKDWYVFFTESLQRPHCRFKSGMRSMEFCIFVQWFQWGQTSLPTMR